MARRKIGTDPGRKELVAVLLRAHAFGGRVVSSLRLRRALGKHVSQATLQTVQGTHSDAVTRNSDSYSLTDTGLKEARRAPSPRSWPIH